MAIPPNPALDFQIFKREMIALYLSLPIFPVEIPISRMISKQLDFPIKLTIIALKLRSLYSKTNPCKKTIFIITQSKNM